MKTTILFCLFLISLFITAQPVTTSVNTNGVLLKDIAENPKIDIDGNTRCMTFIRDDTLIFKVSGAFPTSVKLINFNTAGEVGMEVDGDGSFAFGEFDFQPSFGRMPVTNLKNGLFRPAPNTAAISTSNEERLRILPDGKIGINTSNPMEQLDVNGRLRIRDVPQDDFLEHVLVLNPVDSVIYTRFLPIEPIENNPIKTEELLDIIAEQNEKIEQLEARFSRIEALEAKLISMIEIQGGQK